MARSRSGFPYQDGASDDARERLRQCLVRNDEIVRRISAGEREVALAREFGISRQRVYAIVQRWRKSGMRMTVNGTDVDVHRTGSETGRWCEVDGEWIGNFYRYGGGRDKKTWERVGGEWMGWTPDKREVGPSRDQRGIIAILIDSSQEAQGD